VTKELANKYWTQTFQQMIDDTVEKTNTIPSEWRAGGRVSKAYPDKENDIWWSDNGPQMVDEFMQWWRNSKWSVYFGETKTPHIEAEYNVMFGEVPVRAFVDLIAVNASGELAVIDYKTGAYMPDTNMQLGLYACCMEISTGVRPTKGYYYNARNGTMEDAGNLSRWTIALFTEMFKQFAKALDAEIFLPNLGMMCKSCSVKDYCHAYGGELAVKLDPLASIDEGK
jgi:RecB family exonuclease